MKGNLADKVETLLQKAGDAIMEVYTSSYFDESRKADLSPVTRADYLSSQIINQGLSVLFPSTPVIDEENIIPDYEIRKNWKRYFLLDPLDGTKEFIKQNGEFCINLALLENNLPVASWIFHPVSNSGWSCIKGNGLWRFGSLEPIIQTTSENNIQKLTLITSRSHLTGRGAIFIEKIKAHYDVEVVKMGSALKQVEVAQGKAGIYIRGSGCSEWDTAAGHLMVEESGGEVLQWDLETALFYNKESIRNPRFIMLSKQLKTTEFKLLINNILSEIN
jgi:3'(2'), 5'-bisphosphate nucleotidase